MKTLETSYAEQLNEIYQKWEYWHKFKLPTEEALKYFNRLLDSGNIIVHEIDDKVVGYVEFWRVNFEQWGRIVCHAGFCAYLEDITSGNIAYVANVWIDPIHRNTEVYKTLRNRFFEANNRCEYFVGEALRKTQSQPIKVFKRKGV